MTDAEKIIAMLKAGKFADVEQGAILQALGEAFPAPEATVQEAIAMHGFGADGEISFDANPLASESEGGTWISAWVWVPGDDDEDEEAEGEAR